MVNSQCSTRRFVGGSSGKLTALDAQSSYPGRQTDLHFFLKRIVQCIYTSRQSPSNRFVRAFYGASLPYGGHSPSPGREKVRASCRVDLDWLLFFMGFEAGNQAKTYNGADLVGADLSALPAPPDASIVAGSPDLSTNVYSACIIHN